MDRKRSDDSVAHDETITPGEPGRRPSIAELPTIMPDASGVAPTGVAPMGLAATGIAATGIDAIGETLGSGSVPPAPSSARRGEPAHGDKLDHFTVLDRLGAGGMGVVLAAYDPDLDRKVAIKLLRPDLVGVASEEDRLRLLREAQAMAKLNHPNVITVHEVGMVGDQIFVAMEYVDGGTLRAKPGAAPRPWREILDQYIQAGRGLAAAHAAGLVHRDFKPENVLIGRDGRVRVTDFGLVGMVDDAARGAPTPAAPRPSRERAIVEAETTSRPNLTDLTRTGSIMGTPAYMAPEQHSGETVDARADQFAFCVAVHEGLYGVRPFTGKTYEKLVENVLAGAVVTPPPEIEIPGWLRAVILRGLSVDPAKRFPDMATLLDQLAYERRHRRRRTAFVAAGFAVVLGVAGVAVLRGDAPRCQGARGQLGGVWDPAIARSVAAVFAGGKRGSTRDLGPQVGRTIDAYAESWVGMWKDACEATHVRGDQTDRVLDLRMRCLHRTRDELGALVAVWTGETDGDTLDHAIDAAAALDPVAGCADLDALTSVVPMPTDPAVRRRIEELERELTTVRALEHSGQYRLAVGRARDLVAATAGLDYSPLRARALHQLAFLFDKVGDHAAAATTFRDAATEASRAANDKLVATSWLQLARIHVAQARYDLAEELLALAIAAVARTGDDRHIQGELANFRGTLRLRQGRYDEAKVSLDASLELYENSFGREHPRTVRIVGNVAVLFMAMGNVERARALLTQVLPTEEKIYGPRHPELVATLNNLAKTYEIEGRPAEARPLMERAIAIAIEVLGPDHPDVGVYHDNLGIVLAGLGDADAARPHHERAIAIAEKTQGPDHPDTARALQNLASIEKDAGNYARARELLERALAASERTQGVEHPVVANMRAALANVLSKQGEHALAQDHYARAIATQERLIGKDHPDLAATLNDFGTELESDGRLDEAAAHYQRALAIWEKALGPDGSTLSIVLTNLGSVANRQRRYRDAIAHCERVRTLDTAALGADHPDIAYSLTCLGIATLGAGRARDAIALLEQGLALRAGKVSPDAEAESKFELARALWSSPRDRSRARKLAESARSQFDQAGAGFTRQRDEAAAWLRTHTVR